MRSTLQQASSETQFCLFLLSPFNAGLLHYLSISRGPWANSALMCGGGPDQAEASVSSPVAQGLRLIQHRISRLLLKPQCSIYQTILQGCHSHSVLSFKNISSHFLLQLTSRLLNGLVALVSFIHLDLLSFLLIIVVVVVVVQQFLQFICRSDLYLNPTTTKSY